tara:strand:+ start:3419 stop:3817 length:399 start_codon:yes stop_codon:yes gene_type:complete
MLTLQQLNNIIDSDVSFNIPYKILSVLNNRCFIYSFITNFYKNNKLLDKNTFTIALIYMYRYKQNSKLNFSNIKPVLETCLILANKYCSDFEIKDSGPLELYLLNKINWNLYISENEYNSFKQMISEFTSLD